MPEPLVSATMMTSYAHDARASGHHRWCNNARSVAGMNPLQSADLEEATVCYLANSYEQPTVSGCTKKKRCVD